MSKPPTSRPSRNQTPDPAPEIDPSRQSPPKKFPENPTPLSDDGVEAAKRNSADRMGSGEDPMVESGVPENDPEQPREPGAE